MRALANRKVVLGLALLVVAGAGGILWHQRGPLLAWYYLRQLAQAREADREQWVERTAGLDAAALPGLLDMLERTDERVCGNAHAALSRITERWQPDDPRWASLTARMVDGFARRGVPGRQCTLLLASEWFRGEPGQAPLQVPRCAGRLLAEVQRTGDKDVDSPALELAAALLTHPEHVEALPICRVMAQKGLGGADPELRVRAIRVAQHPGLTLLPLVTPLLSDPDAKVRRAAVLAVGSSAEMITTDNLLPWLHDPDADVRRLCEAALLARDDFRPELLPLARLATAPQPSVRLQLLNHLQSDSRLEPGVWLRRLSQDPAPEVRVAAIRAASSQAEVDLTEQLQEMVRSDPSPTVRQLARYYLQQPKQR